jgi:hypothetical protein
MQATASAVQPRSVEVIRQFEERKREAIKLLSADFQQQVMRWLKYKAPMGQATHWNDFELVISTELVDGVVIGDMCAKARLRGMTAERREHRGKPCLRLFDATTHSHYASRGAPSELYETTPGAKHTINVITAGAPAFTGLDSSINIYKALAQITEMLTGLTSGQPIAKDQLDRIEDSLTALQNGVDSLRRTTEALVKKT